MSDEAQRPTIPPALDDVRLDQLLQAAWGTSETAPKSSPSPCVLDAARYERFERIGVGGMGVVYRTYDRQQRRTVALKVVRPGMGQVPSEGEPETPFDVTPPPAESEAGKSYAELTTRFLQEAWLTGALEHPGVVPVYEMGVTPHGVPYYTMRYVRDVRTLETALEAAQSAEDRLELLDPFLQVCDVLEFAHACGVVHRDVKPANIGLGMFGEVMVLDWGLAKMRDAPDVAEPVWKDRVIEFRNARDLHTVAQALGTPGYMSPEAAMGRIESIDGRSDVYSLGAILYRILTGRLPVEFHSYADLIQKLRSGPPAPASALEPEVSTELADICSRALASDGADRWETAGTLAAAVRRYERQSRVRAEMRSLMEKADAAFGAAESLEGEPRLRQLDRVRAMCDAVLARRPEHNRAQTLLARCGSLQQRTDEERARAIQESAERDRQSALDRQQSTHRAERERMRRRVVYAALVALFVIAAGTGVAAWVFAGQRSEAQEAERRNWGLLRDLGVTQEDRDAAQNQVGELLEAQSARQASLRRLRTERDEGADEAAEMKNAWTAASARVAELEAAAARRSADLKPPAPDDTRVRALAQHLEQALRTTRSLRAELRDERVSAQGMQVTLRGLERQIAELRRELATARKRVGGNEAPDASGVPQATRLQLDALVTSENRRATSMILKYAMEATPVEQDYAIAALGRRVRVSLDALDTLCDLLERMNDRPERLLRVFRAIEETRDARAAPRLIKFLRKSNDRWHADELFRGAMRAVARMPSRDTLSYLLDHLGYQISDSGLGITTPIVEALGTLTGLPFADPATWIRWGAHARKNWEPVSFDPRNAVREYCHHGWRLCLKRPSEQWAWSRPEGVLVRLHATGSQGAWQGAWVEVRAHSGLETWPRADGESSRSYAMRCLQEAASAARKLLPSSMRAGADARERRRVRLGRLVGIQLAGDDPEEGTWRVHVAQKDDLVYTVVVHHGPHASTTVRRELDEIVKSFRSLDR